MKSAFRRRGSVLIVVLFVSVVLSLLAVSLAYRSALVLRASRQRAIMVKLQSQADSVAAIAMSRIIENKADFDHPAQSWHTHGPLASENWINDWTAEDGGEPPQFTADYRINDEEGKLHILRASSDALQKLSMTDDQIACLFDYMDDDDYSHPDGAENGYYQSLVPPRRCKNAPLETLDELLSIKGFGPADYWGRWDGGDDQFVGWVNVLTCLGAGRININTAPRAVLTTLGISDGGVDQVNAFRQFDAFSSGQIEEHAFRSLQDIEQLQGLSDTDRHMLAGKVTFKSEYFRIMVMTRHPPTGLRCNVDMLVRRHDEKVDVLQRRRSSW